MLFLCACNLFGSVILLVGQTIVLQLVFGTTLASNLGVPQLPGQGCSFHSFRTNTYKLTFMESPSGIKIILVTHPRTSDLRESLKYIYNLYVEYVVKNPLYTPGTPIRLQLVCRKKTLVSLVFRISCMSQFPLPITTNWPLGGQKSQAS
ncbi:trafficking protein particle complex subunit 1-like [Pyrus ussuriensis x Pyrus communis]|uniref:Trafficking protein particle complex subunit n=1 Tax=Pyrus ussuriensis x Pyrus communis TaxID=2448454 RepID=A0A5N5FNN1_9ROSA|nr:trafficking protein particle complex subunit 1-like [Pyrus ussuriensis x Pyrus communis]KAB2604487.1 trafficking protein particle complex subunit 1-like [Pyrus ussuriensis x Pyrus communis]